MKKNAFKKLINASINASMLKLYDPKKEIRIESNASDLTVKACLNQKYDGKQHSIAYLSKKLSSAEQNYDVHDKKLLTIVVALEN